MKDTFYVGDMVEVLPYAQVQDHYWLPEDSWNDCVQKNPLTIRSIAANGEIRFKEVGCYLMAPALIRYIPPQLVEVGDLI